MYKSILLYMSVESKISNLTGFDLESDMAAATQFTHAKALQSSTSPWGQVRSLEMEAHYVKRLGKNCWKMLEKIGKFEGKTLFLLTKLSLALSAQLWASVDETCGFFLWNRKFANRTAFSIYTCYMQWNCWSSRVFISSIICRTWGNAYQLRNWTGIQKMSPKTPSPRLRKKPRNPFFPSFEG